MSLHEFDFSLRIEDAAPSSDMIGQIADAVARQAGCAPRTAGELAAAIRAAFSARHSGGAPCDVQFRAHAGQLHVIVSCAGAEEWRASQKLP